MKNYFLFMLSSFVAILLNTTNITAQGFLRVEGEKIINDVDQDFILKGMGLGGWLVQEGYMLNTPIHAEHEIRSEIQKLVGTEKTNELYQLYHHNYVRKIDIDSLAEWGFNSIRLPMHWNKLVSSLLIYNEEGFKTIDTLLTWCEENEMYLILDLHAAPGGQSDGAISDYNSDELSLWESEVNKNITVDLWKTIATRYADEEWIGGYDLINEPAWDLGADNVPLRDLYIRITNAIREVDNNHIIFIEGNWYATTFDGLTPPWDDNMVYSFHKYWNQTDQGTINYLVGIRSTHNRPLWLGETGENSNDWFRECVELMDQNNIGWAWWPHKKIDNISGPLSAPKVDGYQDLLNYWGGSGGQPSEEEAYNVLTNQFNALKFENCKLQQNVHKSLFEPQLEVSVPYKNHSLPGTIFGTDYDSGGQLVGYNDNDYKNTGSGSYNSGWVYRNDGVDIERCSDSKTNGFNVGWTDTGEWLKFTANIPDSGEYDFSFRFASTSNNGKFMLDLDETNLIGLTDIPNTGDWQNWQTVKVNNITLPAGNHTLKLRFFFNGFNYNYMEVSSSVTGINDAGVQPNDYKLFQNYPNPFNPNSVIQYNIPELSEVTITLFNSIGEKQENLVNSLHSPGSYKINIDGSKLSSGIYYCQFKGNSLENDGKHHSIIKMVLLK